MLRLAYFFALWLAIETVVLNAGAFSRGLPELAGLYVKGLIAPESPLWFIQQLFLFYLVTRTIRRRKPAHVLAGAAVLQILAAAGLFQFSWSVLDHFAANFVFFYAGYAGASLVFQFANGVVTRMQDLAWGLTVWAGVHTAFVAMGIADLPIVSLILGFGGAFALAGIGVILARLPAAHFIGDAGRHSFAIYLGFFHPAPGFAGACEDERRVCRCRRRKPVDRCRNADHCAGDAADRHGNAAAGALCPPPDFQAEAVRGCAPRQPARFTNPVRRLGTGA